MDSPSRKLILSNISGVVLLPFPNKVRKHERMKCVVHVEAIAEIMS